MGKDWEINGNKDLQTPYLMHWDIKLVILVDKDPVPVYLYTCYTVDFGKDVEGLCLLQLGSDRPN